MPSQCEPSKSCQITAGRHLLNDAVLYLAFFAKCETERNIGKRNYSMLNINLGKRGRLRQTTLDGLFVKRSRTN